VGVHLSHARHPIGPDGTISAPTRHHTCAVHADRQAAQDTEDDEHDVGPPATTARIRSAIPRPQRGPVNAHDNVAVGPNGTSTSQRAYAIAAVHQVPQTGQLKRSWGVPGKGPGHVPPAPRHRRRPTTGRISSAIGRRTTGSRSSDRKREYLSGVDRHAKAFYPHRVSTLRAAA